MSTPQPEPPRLDPIPPGTETCECCGGVERHTPVRTQNRTGLSAIAYRIGSYAQFRESLHAGLSSSQFAALARLRTRDNDDFTIGLLDAVACAADVLTFYQERIANESYLRTATERLSLEEMGRLIGYRLRPGAAAETYLAFTLETPPAIPANMKPEPGTFVSGVPTEITIDARLAVRSVPAPDEKPQVFETVAPVTARPQWNAMRPWLSDALRPKLGDQFTYFDGVRTNLKAGDALVFLGPQYLAHADSKDWDFRILDRVEPQPEHDRTFVSWSRGLDSIAAGADSAQQTQAWVLRTRASIYGHNAPAWGAMSNEFRLSYELAYPRDPGSPATGWPNFVVSPRGVSSDGGFIDLDAPVAELAPDGLVVLTRGGFRRSRAATGRGTHVQLYVTNSMSDVSREEFAMSGKVTRLELTGDEYSLFANGVRETRVFAQSEQLELAEYPVDEPVGGEQIPVSIGADGLSKGRQLLIAGVRQRDGRSVVHAATLVSATPVKTRGRTRCWLEISPPLPEPLVRDSVVVMGNVAPATHGETAAQILGAGNASVPFQRFELKQLPLTWRSAPGELGAASELNVTVDDIAWQERPTLFGATPEDRAFTLQSDEQGRQFVQFGDGLRGARLPSGINNVRATYRKGIGAAGNVAAESLTQLGTRPLGLKAVSNPLQAEGGTNPESADQARQTMPLMTRTLGRAVSVLDYEDYARAFTGVSKARAQVLRLSSGPAVVITIAGDDNTVISTSNPVWTNLLAALMASGDPHVPVRLLAHHKSTFRIGLKVKRDPAYDIKKVLAAVEAALRAHFSFRMRALGQPVQQSEVIAVAHSVPGVVAVDLDLLYGGTSPVSQTQGPRHVRLLAERMGIVGGRLVPAELLTLDDGPLAELEEMR